MTTERDYTGRYRIVGYEHLTFSTEADALAAMELARAYDGAQMLIESRLRRAAKAGIE
jgi:hypothetical protein